MSRSKHRLADGASIAEHARRLQQRPGWDPEGRREAPDQTLQRQLGELRVSEVTEQSQGCADCSRVREAQHDPGALCRAHLAQAMGVRAEA